MGKQNFSIDMKMIYMCVQLYDSKNMVKHNDLRNQGFQVKETNQQNLYFVYILHSQMGHPRSSSTLPCSQYLAHKGPHTGSGGCVSV